MRTGDSPLAVGRRRGGGGGRRGWWRKRQQASVSMTGHLSGRFSPSMIDCARSRGASRSINERPLCFLLALAESRTTMKAVYVREFGGPEVLKVETDVPVPTISETQVKRRRGRTEWNEPADKRAAQQVLIRVGSAGVNPVDTYIRMGLFANLPSLPYIPGRDGSGTVEKVGAKVTTTKVRWFLGRILQIPMLWQVLVSLTGTLWLILAGGCPGRRSSLLLGRQRLLRRVRRLRIALGVSIGRPAVLRPGRRSGRPLLHGPSGSIHQVRPSSSSSLSSSSSSIFDARLWFHSRSSSLFGVAYIFVAMVLLYDSRT